MTIYVWPDGTWVKGEYLNEYLTWMSDDYMEMVVPAYMSDEEIDKIVTRRLQSDTP